KFAILKESFSLAHKLEGTTSGECPKGRPKKFTSRLNNSGEWAKPRPKIRQYRRKIKISHISDI
ncbi:Chitinase, partial [Candida maltosa Xu316]